MGYFLGQAFDDGENDYEYIPPVSMEDLHRRIADQEKELNMLRQILDDLMKAFSRRAQDALGMSDSKPQRASLPPLPRGIPVIRHTFGSLYGGREHSDPDGEHSALPLEDGTFLFDGEIYGQPERT